MQSPRKAVDLWDYHLWYTLRPPHGLETDLWSIQCIHVHSCRRRIYMLLQNNIIIIAFNIQYMT